MPQSRNFFTCTDVDSSSLSDNITAIELLSRRQAFAKHTFFLTLFIISFCRRPDIECSTLNSLKRLRSSKASNRENSHRPVAVLFEGLTLIMRMAMRRAQEWLTSNTSKREYSLRPFAIAFVPSKPADPPLSALQTAIGCSTSDGMRRMQRTLGRFELRPTIGIFSSVCRHAIRRVGADLRGWK